MWHITRDSDWGVGVCHVVLEKRIFKSLGWRAERAPFRPSRNLAWFITIVRPSTINLDSASAPNSVLFLWCWHRSQSGTNVCTKASLPSPMVNLLTKSMRNGVSGPERKSLWCRYHRYRWAESSYFDCGIWEPLIVGRLTSTGLYGIQAARYFLDIHPEADVILLESDTVIGGTWSQSRWLFVCYCPTHSFFANLNEKVHGLTNRR